MLFEIKSTENQKIIQHEQFVCGKTKIKKLPVELILEIFSCLDLETLSKCSLVRKKWNRIASDPTLLRKAIYERAFNIKKWKMIFGKDITIPDEESKADFLALPLHISEIFEKLNRVYPEQKFELCWCVKSINDKPLTMINFGQFVKKHFPKNEHNFYSNILSYFHEKDSIKIHGHWIFISTEVIKGSESLKFFSQEQIIRDIKIKSKIPLTVPSLLDMFVCNVTKFLYSKKVDSIFESKTISSRSANQSDVGRMVIGNCTENGLVFSRELDTKKSVEIGIKASMNFWS